MLRLKEKGRGVARLGYRAIVIPRATVDGTEGKGAAGAGQIAAGLLQKLSRRKTAFGPKMSDVTNGLVAIGWGMPPPDGAGSDRLPIRIQEYPMHVGRVTDCGWRRGLDQSRAGELRQLIAFPQF